MIPGGSGTQIAIYNRKNVHIKGCGMNGTRIQWMPGSSNGELVRIADSRWVTLQDMKLRVAPSAHDNLDVVLLKGSRDVTFERVHLHQESRGFAMRVLELPGTIPKQIFFRDGRIHSLTVGLILGDCTDCWVSGSWFGTIPGDPGGPKNLAQKRVGDGVRFVNNTFDLEDLPSQRVIGLNFYRDQASAGDEDDVEGETAQAVGNSFIHIGAESTGFRFYGYRNGIVSDNLFKCVSPGACSEGIRFQSNGSGTVENRENLITGNQFVDFQEVGIECPIKLQDGSDNVVEGNVFRLHSSSTTQLGVCGDTANNVVGTNHPFFPQP